MLFGEGEERRDHVLVDDLGELVRRMVMHRSTGVLNGATGEVHSFRAIAEMVAGNPQRRLIEPAEVARAVAWLADPASGSMTGQAIAVAGGEIM